MEEKKIEDSIEITPYKTINQKIEIDIPEINIEKATSDFTIIGVNTLNIINVQEKLSKLIFNRITKSVDSFSFPIGEDILKIIKVIIEKNPESLDKIKGNIKNIIADGVIDFKDIPSILILVTNLYKTDLKNIAKSLTNEKIVELLKCIIKIIIDLDVIPVTNKTEIFTMIDLSGQLLAMVLPNNYSCCKF